MTERKKLLLRLDPAVHDAIARWAADELRSTNAQIEFLLRRALGDAGRMPGDARRPVRRGRPPKRQEPHEGPDGGPDGGERGDGGHDPGRRGGGDAGHDDRDTGDVDTVGE
ncbi:hypothetical protein [Yinghuangia seranimata]|uniref:hypothetical protein n=1 Tax=Yinghuangia seranimata TaxID=408067 RepID=UPI00248B0784|nr:hypothetical protein [Yinghuangia seranimata]MDI2129805.1 hypothetical protein [Yinghuangia seranimata]